MNISLTVLVIFFINICLALLLVYRTFAFLYHTLINIFFLVEAWFSLEQYIGLKEDKLSSTTVDFIRSEGNLETKCLIWFWKPKMC